MIVSLIWEGSKCAEGQETVGEQDMLDLYQGLLDALISFTFPTKYLSIDGTKLVGEDTRVRYKPSLCLVEAETVLQD